MTIHEQNVGKPTRGGHWRTILIHISSFWLRALKGVLGLSAIVLIGYLGWLYTSAAQTNADKHQTKGPAPIPVTIQTINNSDFPVYLNGLGTVQPYDTVTVRSRVDGQVIKVGFRQGQMVNEGDLLVQIDSRPYQAALEQAQAKKAQDEANLRNAQLDLERYSTLAKQDYASRQQVDTQQAKVDQLNAQLKGDQAAIDNAQTQLSYTTIRSPLTGKNRLPPHRSRQHRARDRPDWHYHDREAPAYFSRLHGAGRKYRADQQSARRGKRAGHSAVVGRYKDSWSRPPRACRQSGRSGKRNDPHEGHL